MKHIRFLTVFAILAVLLMLSGCQYIDSLKARDQLNRGVKSFRAKKYADAIDFFKKAVELDPDLMITYEYLGMTYMKRWIPGKDDLAAKAILSFKKALEYDDKNVNVLLRLARTYYTTGQLDESAQCYEKIHNEVDPENPMPLFGIGLIKWGAAKNEIGDNGQRADVLLNDARTAKEGLEKNEKELENKWKRLERVRKEEQRQEIETEIEKIEEEMQEQKQTIEHPAEVMKIVDEAIAALDKSNELKENYMTVRYLSLSYFQKSSLTEDDALKTEYRKKASRLAIKELQLKKQEELKEKEEKETVF